MDNKRIYVDIHALQIVPPSCINRDDTGAPKTCIYGGTMRSRVSSQSWKRSTEKNLRNYTLMKQESELKNCWNG